MNALEKVRKVRESLESSGIEDADREAEMIVSHCLGTDRIYLYRDNPPVPDIVTREIDTILSKLDLSNYRTVTLNLRTPEGQIHFFPPQP